MAKKTPATNDSAIHPFQAAGLGTAPFRVVGFDECKYRAHPDAPVQCGTSCDYCGTGIMYVFKIRGSGAEDKAFKVGSDCVARTGDEPLTTECRIARARYVPPAVAEERRAQALQRAERLALTAALNVAAFGGLLEELRTLVSDERVSRYNRDELNFARRSLESGERDGVKHGPLTEKEDRILAAARRERDYPATRYAGAPGARVRKMGAFYEHTIPYETTDYCGQPTVKAINFFRVVAGDQAGSLLVWFTDSAPHFKNAEGGWTKVERGERVLVTATVKTCNMRGDVPQTVVQRAVVERAALIQAPPAPFTSSPRSPVAGLGHWRHTMLKEAIEAARYKVGGLIWHLWTRPGAGEHSARVAAVLGFLVGTDDVCVSCAHDKPRGGGCYECGADVFGEGGDVGKVPINRLINDLRELEGRVKALEKGAPASPPSEPPPAF